MIRRIITLFTLLVVISSCKAQGNNNIKQNKTSERTTERFDTSTYYMERQGHEYQFEHTCEVKCGSLEVIMALII